jgi:uncharacterized protein YbaA (DUF1428 family)
MAGVDGQIIVELKLAMEQAFKQAREGAAAISKEFSKASMVNPLAKVAAETDKMAASEDKVTKAVKERTKAVKALTDQQQRLRDIASGKLSPVAPGMTIRDVSGSGTIPLTQEEREAMGPAHRAGIGGTWSTSAGGGLATGAPYLGAKPPVLPQSGPGSNIMDLIKNLRNLVLPIGQVIASFYMVGFVLKQAAAPLQDFVRTIGQAAAAAKRLYASSAMSGMGVGMTASRGAFANALGVSENDIFQFGKQIGFLNSQLQGAIKTTTRSNPALATMGIEFSVLETNLTALRDNVVASLAPTIIGLTQEFISLAQAMNALFDEIKNMMVGLATNLSSAVMPAWLSAMVNPFIAAITDAGKITIAAIGTPTAWMKQLPASNWEHMGLQIGGGVGLNYAQQTARNTAKMAVDMHALYVTMSSTEFKNAPSNPASP